jgi:hypothetical protein
MANLQKYVFIFLLASLYKIAKKFIEKYIVLTNIVSKTLFLQALLLSRQLGKIIFDVYFRKLYLMNIYENYI